MISNLVENHDHDHVRMSNLWSIENPGCVSFVLFIVYYLCYVLCVINDVSSVLFVVFVVRYLCFFVCYLWYVLCVLSGTVFDCPV